MEIKDFKKDLFDLIEENKIKLIFEKLKEELNDESDKFSNFRPLRRRYNEYINRKMANTISYEEGQLTINKIIDTLSEFIDCLEQADIDVQQNYSHRELFNPILVFTKEEEVENIRNFFLQLNFANIEVKGHSNNDLNTEDFDLIVFDNQDLPVCPSEKVFANLSEDTQQLIQNRIEEMNLVVQNTSKFIIHLGNFLFWINSNRNRVQAANSKFSLHARTKEVIDFINTYRV